MIDVNIPFHGRAGGKKGYKRLDRSQRLNRVGFGTVYLGDGAELGFGVAIAWGLATPWTSVDVRLIVYDPDNGESSFIRSHPGRYRSHMLTCVDFPVPLLAMKA